MKSEFSIADLNDNKINRYVDLVLNYRALVKSSQSLIRRKKSPLALAIKSGKKKSIEKASLDIVFSKLPSHEDRKRLCAIFCDFKNKLKTRYKATDTEGSKRSETFRKLIFEAVAHLLSFVFKVGVTNAMIALLWNLRSHLYKFLCKCKLDFQCNGLGCNS